MSNVNSALSFRDAISLGGKETIWLSKTSGYMYTRVCFNLTQLFLDHVHLGMRSMQSVMSSEVFLNPRGEEADSLRMELSQVNLDTTGNSMAFRPVFTVLMSFD